MNFSLYLSLRYENEIGLKRINRQITKLWVEMILCYILIAIFEFIILCSIYIIMESNIVVLITGFQLIAVTLAIIKTIGPNEKVLEKKEEYREILKILHNTIYPNLHVLYDGFEREDTESIRNFVNLDKFFNIIMTKQGENSYKNGNFVLNTDYENYGKIVIKKINTELPKYIYYLGSNDKETKFILEDFLEHLKKHIEDYKAFREKEYNLPIVKREIRELGFV